MHTLATQAFPSWAILLLLVVFFGLIALTVFFISKFLPGVKKTEEEKEVDEKTRIQEELDRILVPIEPAEAEEPVEPEAPSETPAASEPPLPPTKDE